MKFRKKPVVVEAEQFWKDKLPLPFNDRAPVVCFDGNRWYVVTIYGELATLTDGDWVILEPRGNGANAYPCKPDIFEATYEKVE